MTEPDLRRAVSDLYFAMLHTICETLAGTLGEPLSYTAAKEAWIRLYRLPDHAHVAKHCDDSRIREFPDEIQRFAAQFKAAKTRREDADYDASATFRTSDIRKMVQLVESAVLSFKAADDASKLAFAFFVALRRR